MLFFKENMRIRKATAVTENLLAMCVCVIDEW